MSSDVPSLSAKQILAVDALARGEYIEVAASQANVTEKTVDRWLKLPEFRQAIQATKHRIHEQAIARIVDANAAAASALKEIVEDANQPAAARVSAAKVLIEAAFKGFRQHEMEAMVEEIKALLHDNTQGTDTA